jgi:hypothetical protein
MVFKKIKSIYFTLSPLNILAFNVGIEPEINLVTAFAVLENEFDVKCKEQTRECELIFFSSKFIFLIHFSFDFA